MKNSVFHSNQPERQRALRVAIVGAGAAGTISAVHLLREAAGTPIEIELIDKTGEFGRGTAYATADPLHLLNVPAVRMGAIAGHPEDFHRWLEDTGVREEEAAFLPRGLYGDYLAGLLVEAERASPEATVTRRTGEVVAVAASGRADAQTDLPGRTILTFADGEAIEVDAAVLALGPPPGGEPIDVPEELKRAGVWIGDPWAPGALDPIRESDSVLVVGTGLTMVDICLSLSRDDRGPEIRAVSRHGLVPRRHRRDLTRIRRFPVPLGEGSLDQILGAVFEQLGRVTQQGDDWRDVIDSMRPETPAIWKALRREDKQRFLKGFHRLWDVHRFRMAPAVAARFDELTTTGRVTVAAGSIMAMERLGSGRLRVSLRTPGRNELETVEVDHIVNCTGPRHDMGRPATALLRDLLDSGVAHPDELGLGLDVDDDGALVGASGDASTSLFAVGALRKGVEWEALGITEIRDQSARIAARLLAFAPAPRAAAEASGSSPHAGDAVDVALADLAAGRMVLLRDDLDNGEGDLLVGAEFATAATINFMAKEARGLIRLALDPERAATLGLDPIPPRGHSSLGEDSLVSIEAKEGVSTGISAADRARTIQVAVDPASGPEDLVQPGHVFPLQARPGGVLERPGRIESAVELATAAGLASAAVLCQVLREDGRTARAGDLDRFAATHGLTVVPVSAVLARRLASARPAQAAGGAPGMREVMGHFATGISVVTTRAGDGAPIGTTANAISSVSLDPPLLLACLDRSSQTLAAIRETGTFAVNVLATHQQEHSERFAARGDAARPHEIAFDDHPLGVPVLPGALATIACEVKAIHRAGDHDIVVGHAQGLSHSGTSTAPLLFYRGGYSELADHQPQPRSKAKVR